MLPHRRLGTSGIEVSALALGSWRTYERMSREDGTAVMRAAREAGITFLDDARYNDETGTAPLSTGYSEVVFGELFRASGWQRDEVVVANKLWWEFWPRESAAEELDGSLGRMRLDHVDLIYSEKPPDGLELAELVPAVTELVRVGKARAWGVLNWPPELFVEASRIADDLGAPRPAAAQVPYNLVLRDPVEGAADADAFDRTGASAVASMTLWYGALTGKYARGATSGRIAGELDEPRLRRALAAGEQVAALAGELDASPAELAIAFALANDRVASVLFGATTPAQVRENAGAAAVLARLGEDGVARLRAIGAG
jgi:L-glyceraldehyde 3-phosphate reductase